jgi:hypothetical protein
VEQFAPHVLADRQGTEIFCNGLMAMSTAGWLPLAGALDARAESKPWMACMTPKWPTRMPCWGSFLTVCGRLGQLDNTLVIICADHGEHLGEKQYHGPQPVYL